MGNTSSLHLINRWVVSIFTVLLVAQAALGGNGLFKSGSMEWLITAHEAIGNLSFLLALGVLVLSYLLWSRKVIGGSTMLASALVFLLTLAQISLGYAMNENLVDIAGWHIAGGVALTAATAVVATRMWTSSPHNGANSTP